MEVMCLYECMNGYTFYFFFTSLSLTANIFMRLTLNVMLKSLVKILQVLFFGAGEIMKKVSEKCLIRRSFSAFSCLNEVSNLRLAIVAEVFCYIY